MISEESLENLNQRLKHHVKMDRFRPNFVIKGGESHIEDDYKFMKIGSVEFQCAKPCARCTVITIDQSNAQKGKEPLLTLSKYRKEGKKVLFGQNLILHNSKHGEIQIGDAVALSDKKI